jgi:hypothetical protein
LVNRLLVTICSAVLLTTACSREPAAPPRETPQIRLAGATELVEFSDWAWTDETRTQMVVNMTRTSNAVGSVRVEFYADAEVIGEDITPGSVFDATNGPHTRELTIPAKATRMVVTVESPQP